MDTRDNPCHRGDMMNMPEWSLADRLRKIRRDRHLTQEEMAQRIGTKAVTLAAWEEGRNRPKDVVGLAQTIEVQFDVPASWVLGVLGGRRSTDRDPLSHASMTADQWARMANPVPERSSSWT